MARYREDLRDDREMRDTRDTFAREDRYRRESPRNYGESYGRDPFERQNRADEYRRSRFGERADYEFDEPRYSNPRGYTEQSDRFRDDWTHRGYYDRGEAYRPQYGHQRSRLRCRDIMTRELAMATRNSTLTDVAIMMKEEDTGVIPVVDNLTFAGNGAETANDVRTETRGAARNKLVGLITDRDIVVRPIAEKKDPGATRAEEIMTKEIHTARPNDRVVDVIRKMADKQVRRIPVVGEDNRLIGMISMADIAVETEADQELADALEEISKGHSFWRQLFG